MTAPAQPKLYHILHVDRLRSVLADGYLFCDARMVNRLHITPCASTTGWKPVPARTRKRQPGEGIESGVTSVEEVTSTERGEPAAAWELLGDSGILSFGEA